MLGIKHAEVLLAAGATVVLADISQQGLANACSRLGDAADGKLLPVVMDVGDETSIVACREFLAKKNLVVDILVNNAARDPKVGAGPHMQKSSRLENLDLDSFALDMRIKVEVFQQIGRAHV